MGVRQQMMDVVETSRHAMQQQARIGEEPGNKESLHIQSIRTHLTDTMNVALPVHLFFALLAKADRALFMVGICEAWRPKSAPSHKSHKARSSKLPKTDFATGTLVPSYPLYSDDAARDLERITQSVAAR